MQKSLPVCRPAALLIVIVGSWTLSAQDLIKNGNFEAGRLPPWTVSASPGGTVTLAAENSPFQAGYSSGANSLHLTDDDSSDYADKPSVRQQFTGVNSLTFGFDFKMPTPGDASPWYVAWNGENDTTGFFFRLGGADGLSVELNFDKIADLKPNVWYHIEGWADAPNQTVQGTISNTLGDRADFSGGFPFGVKNEINAVVISDGDPARNPEVLLDNFYGRPITLAITTNAQGQQVLTWPAKGFTLQTTTGFGPGAEWTNIPATAGSYTNLFSDKIRFFRLIN